MESSDRLAARTRGRRRECRGMTTTTAETTAVAVAGCLADLISQCQIATVVWHNPLKGCGAVSLGPRWRQRRVAREVA